MELTAKHSLEIGISAAMIISRCSVQVEYMLRMGPTYANSSQAVAY